LLAKRCLHRRHLGEHRGLNRRAVLARAVLALGGDAQPLHVRAVGVRVRVRVRVRIWVRVRVTVTVRVT
jgi:hypothetical protein